jgi:hypothetical protein
MKEDLQKVFDKGVEFANEAGNAIKKLGDEVYDKSKVYYDKGVEKTKEFDRDVKDFIKYRKDGKVSKEELMSKIDSLDPEEKKEILDKLKEETK